MDFDDAIQAHSDWKRKLRAYLAKPDGTLRPDEVGATNKCQLGQWIAGEGTLYAAFTEFAALAADHACFHKAAAELVRKANSGRNVDREIALGANSAFTKATSKIISAIVALKKKT
jgi:hypothetical protein